jgi:3-deoxy-7-phosphoheptulonate synthase
MIVVMSPGATLKEIGAVIQAVEAEGLKAQMSKQEAQSTVGILGEPADTLGPRLEKMPGVERVVSVVHSFKISSRAYRPEDTRVRVGQITIGEGTFTVMAGPCAVESAEQVMRTARHVAAAGAAVLRGGAFKPRTSPYSFQGLGEEGLKHLQAASRETGLSVVTEAMGPGEVELVVRYADILQIGARNMQNFRLLEAAGRQPKPVLLKRGLSSTVEELLLAAEYVMACGNPNVILCERGIRTFEKFTRNTLDISAVPVIKRLSHLPVIVDPSHAAGVREYVAPLARAAVAVGADGVIIEAHPEPEKALCDGKQSLTLDDFDGLMRDLRVLARDMGKAWQSCEARRGG